MRQSDEDNFLISVNEERRRSDGKPLKEMTKTVRMNCLKKNDFGTRRVVYRMPLHEGKRQEVYSEWVVK